MNYKTKDELDLMQRQDIMVYRDGIITNTEKSDFGARRYCDEILFYIMVRFIDYERSVHEKLVGQKIFDSKHFEMLYITGLVNHLPEDNIFKYIVPMVMPNDVTLDKLIKTKEILKKISRK